jgi:hypothetical protein
LIGVVVAEGEEIRRLRASLLRPGRDAGLGNIMAIEELRNRRRSQSVRNALKRTVLEIASITELGYLTIGKFGWLLNSSAPKG